MTVIFRTLIPKYGNFAKIVVRNKMVKWIKPTIDNKFLFILSPPYCGSTLLNEIISTSSSVSVNNPNGTREGQHLPTVKKIMFNYKTKWDENVDFDWEYIKKEWMKYWDVSKPILLEKSPPNIMRAESISKAFPNSYFVIFHRNPYSHCESLIRRNNYTPREAAEFALKSLRFQKKNMQSLSNSMVISYEELTDDPNAFNMKIKTLLPELKGINTNIEFSAHNFKGKPLKIKNLNREKISKLTQSQLNEINNALYKDKELLRFFNYEIIDTV